MSEILRLFNQSEFSRNNTEGFLPPEDVIAAPYPFIAIGDLQKVVSRINPKLEYDPGIDSFQRRLLCIEKKFAPENSSFFYIDQPQLVRSIENQIEKDVTLLQAGGKKVGVVNFDRYILSKNTSDDIFRLNFSRGSDGQLTIRPGATLSKSEQIEKLLEWMKAGKYTSLIFTDDVVAFATTFPPVIDDIRRIYPGIDISVLCGICSSGGVWQGKQKLESLGIRVNAVIMSNASDAIEGRSSGMAIPDSRDFTIFGGKIGASASGRALSYPYFLPFSEPSTSFIVPERRGEASKQFFRYNVELVDYLERSIGSRLLVSDLENAGFGVPFTLLTQGQNKITIPDGNVLLGDYLREVRSL